MLPLSLHAYANPKRSLPTASCSDPQEPARARSAFLEASHQLLFIFQVGHSPWSKAGSRTMLREYPGSENTRVLNEKSTLSPPTSPKLGLTNHRKDELEHCHYLESQAEFLRTQRQEVFHHLYHFNGQWGGRREQIMGCKL